MDPGTEKAEKWHTREPRERLWETSACLAAKCKDITTWKPASFAIHLPVTAEATSESRSTFYTRKLSNEGDQINPSRKSPSFACKGLNHSLNPKP